MTRDFVIACAGAGKSRKIVMDALSLSDEGKPSLILTYTEKNQQELQKKFIIKRGVKPSNITIKGWFAFLLEDLIRPYQRYVFPNRIMGLNFNDEGNPHTRGKYTIPDRTEEDPDTKFYRWEHYTSIEGSKAHSMFISKLAVKIAKESKKKSIERITQIYSGVFIDEVQDLTGWDYGIIELLNKSNLEHFCCVGDFRQTIYATHHPNKHPKYSQQKRARFNDMHFKEIYLSENWRCCQNICEVSDLVHAGEGYDKTTSKLNVDPSISPKHIGVFIVKNSDVSEYIRQYNPVILRLSKAVEPALCKGQECYNFGISKGMQFERILIIPTTPQKNFLLGNKRAFSGGKTDKSKNTFYVALTRAKYSVTIVMDEDSSLQGVSQYIPPYK